ncbi:hypothetical protein B0O99DRAFT_689051 [Bisporella sp. PMI_857]|nr:hypothetical protein B0O99DRAFT_689051 [Bisporella sp. PMI_857]
MKPQLRVPNIRYGNAEVTSTPAATTVLVPSIAQGKILDYERELAMIIGKIGENIKKEEALSYIAGYAPSNDVSVRTWQRDPAFAGAIPQRSFVKSFDTFAPIGPMLLKTLVNGGVRQDTNTSDLLFGVLDLLVFLSQGQTLQKGTAIMTSTPGGAALGMEAPNWLVQGGVVEVKIEKLGRRVNKIVYE